MATVKKHQKLAKKYEQIKKKGNERKSKKKVTKYVHIHIVKKKNMKKASCFGKYKKSNVYVMVMTELVHSFA